MHSADLTGAGISFELTGEQRALQELAHDFAVNELRPIAREWDDKEDCPAELLGKAAALGLTSHAIPVEYGGGGVSAVTSSLIAEELSWGCAGLAAPIGATMFPVRPLLRSGTEEQKQRWLPRLASDEGCLAAIAFTEPGAGSDVMGIQATVRRDGDEYVLNGEKCYVTNGGIAELTIVFAKLEGAITAFLVESGDPGVSAGRKEPKLGLRASYTGSILLDDARVPADRILGDEGEGFAIAMDFFMHSRPQVAASALGIARAAFEYATEYANERRAFGKPLIAKQGVSFKLADMAIQVEAARLLVWRAAAALDAGRRRGLARLLREGVRRRRGDEHHDRRRAGPGRRRDHARPPRREVDAGREGAPDRRGNVGDPAARDRPVPAQLSRSYPQAAMRRSGAKPRSGRTFTIRVSFALTVAGYPAPGPGMRVVLFRFIPPPWPSRKRTVNVRGAIAGGKRCVRAQWGVWVAAKHSFQAARSPGTCATVTTAVPPLVLRRLIRARADVWTFRRNGFSPGTPQATVPSMWPRTEPSRARRRKYRS